MSSSNFFFSSRRRHTRCGRDWSSDVCSSDLRIGVELLFIIRGHVAGVSAAVRRERDKLPVRRPGAFGIVAARSEEHTSELQSRPHLVCRLLLEKKNMMALRNTIDWFETTEPV